VSTARLDQASPPARRLDWRHLAAMVAFSIVLLVLGVLAVVWWTQPIAAFWGRRGPWDAADFATLYSAADLVFSGQAHLLYHPDALFDVQNAAVGRPAGEALAYPKSTDSLT
jgi:hypothetical protein